MLQLNVHLVEKCVIFWHTWYIGLPCWRCEWNICECLRISKLYSFILFSVNFVMYF